MVLHQLLLGNCNATSERLVVTRKAGAHGTIFGVLDATTRPHPNWSLNRLATEFKHLEVSNNGGRNCWRKAGYRTC